MPEWQGTTAQFYSNAWAIETERRYLHGESTPAGASSMWLIRYGRHYADAEAFWQRHAWRWRIYGQAVRVFIVGDRLRVVAV
jgi:hypothetical protein